MNRSSWHIPGSHLLLWAALYASMGILLEADSAVLLRMALVAAGNLLAQGAFAALIGPSRYLVPIRPWRLVSCVGTGALAVVAVVVPVYLLIVKDRQSGFLYGIGSILAMCLATLTLVWSLGPLLVFLYCRRLRRMLKGQCLACGYDLRGLWQMRCPECGRPFTFEEVHATAEGLQFAGRASPQASANS